MLFFNCDRQSGGKPFRHGAHFLFCIHAAIFSSGLLGMVGSILAGVMIPSYNSEETVSMSQNESLGQPGLEHLNPRPRPCQTDPV